jgi:hypothetical protein
VDALDDLERVRSEISFRDYDGDHNTQEGIQREIWDLQAILYQAIQVYASQSGTAIAYQEQVAPYFFIDNDANGEVNESELDADNAFNTWTGRLLKASYNYHFSIQDSGAFIHNPKYILQLLYDSIEDLDAELADGLVRDDAGHFAGSGVAWRYWDADGEVDRDCARCHSANGLPTYLTTGRNYRSEPLTNDMLCTTCHPDQNMPYRYPAGAVTFPSEATLSIDSDNNLCMNCHKGRAAAISIDEITDGLDPDSISDGLKLPDIHGYPAGATLFGSLAAGAYQYKGKRYAGRNLHVEEFDDCLNCHGEHRLDIDEEQCATCHGHRASEERTKPQHHPSPMRCRDCHGMVDVEKIRGHKDYTVPEDHDGDGDILEGISQEVATLHATLYTAIQTYANDVAGTPIIYYATAPYFFIDTNGDSQSDPIEIIPDNRYRTWTPRLLQAAYNYLYSAKDPAAYAHNGDYILQILYDSLVDIDGDTRGMVRP